MQVLPAMADAHLPAVSRGIAELQRVVGDHFAPAQGGRFASPAVGEVLNWFERRGITGVGQSSWGPTGFALVGDDARAHALTQEAQATFTQQAVQLQVVRARNYGGMVERYQYADTTRTVRAR
jgi:predicted sugar kinase